jgi:hypothetical protein
LRTLARALVAIGLVYAFSVGAPIATADSPVQVGCDPLDPAVCLQPFPNDYFTVPDSSTDTGRRVNFDITAMPQNVAGNPIRPDEWNRNDGFSPGQELVTKVPGLDTQQAFQNTGAVPQTDIERSYDPNQPIVVINADTLQRHLIWSELDANPTNPADANLIVRPAVNWDEGGHYIVALRRLKDASGNTIPAQQPFRVYRDRRPSSDPAVEARRPHMEQILMKLRQSGVGTRDLYLAWDFTVASKRNLSERALYLRDQAFAALGDTNLSDLQVQGTAPQYQVTQTTDYTPCGTDGCQSGEDDQIVRKIDGDFTVPCFLNAAGCPPGSRFSYVPGSSVPQPIPGNVMAANFTCLVPRSVVAGSTIRPARPSLYGHGLLGSASEVTAGNVKAMANENNFVFCATDWSGMSTQDLPNIASILADLSNFSSLPDRAQQGFVNFLYLGRLLIHPGGFSNDPAFRFLKNGVLQRVIDTRRLFYDGNSQGGIMGGSLAALAPDYNRAVLGVPGMNYSTLLRRSVDFDQYAAVLYQNYPNELERPLILSLMQMLWDRGEADGYAHHMTTDPYPNTPAHTVLLHEAFGDHQVANVATEVEARTIGASIRVPTLDPGRHSDVNPYFGIPAIPSYPFDGSALVVWDSGSPTPPANETPPRTGADPHSHPRSTPAARLQKSQFLRLNGKVLDVCGPTPCYANGYTGNGQ